VNRGNPAKRTRKGNRENPGNPAKRKRQGNQLNPAKRRKVGNPGNQLKSTPIKKPPTNVEIPTGLKTKGQVATLEIKEGAGETAKAGDEVTVQYVGVGVKSKKQFDSSWGRGEPLSFKLGAGEVIKGWDEGIEGMKVGGRRELYVPPNLAYGSEGTESIKPNEDIVFVVDLLAVKSGA
jgi:peptidylprolyl isomerase